MRAFIGVLLMGCFALSQASIVNLDASLSNKNQYVNSLFEQGVRNLDRYQDSIYQQGSDHVVYSLQNFNRTLDYLVELWNGKTPEGTNSKDRALIQFIKRYVIEHKLVMYKPQLEYVGKSGAAPTYRILGYQHYDLSLYPKHLKTPNFNGMSLSECKSTSSRNSGAIAPFCKFDSAQTHYVKSSTSSNALGINDNSDVNVREFLKLFLLGGHFVVRDVEDRSRSGFLRSFRQQLSRDQHHNLGNSHYTLAVNLHSSNYLRINQSSAKKNDGFLLSFLIGPTTVWQGKPDTFFQLEGWQPSIKGMKRHQFDFETFQKYRWNISTFGACAYSEKRGTAIFLAKKGWQPEVSKNTVMPPYRGAEVAQHWLGRDLVVN